MSIQVFSWRGSILYLNKYIMYRYFYITWCCVQYVCVTSQYLYILFSYHCSYRYFCLIVVCTDISMLPHGMHWYFCIQSQYIQIFQSHHIMYRHFCVTLWCALIFLCHITISADIYVTSWYVWIFLCHLKFSQKPAFEIRHCFYSSNWRMWRGASYQTLRDPAQCTFFAAAWFIPGRYDICPTVPNAGIITSQEPINACPINCVYATPSAPPAITQQQWVFCASVWSHQPILSCCQ